ncbi:MAG: peptidoglycan-binding protein [Candidatus Omnitrophica bacterium]|nr:peptidoglycan-binding protein [Candidatus Omnitrophota bacterium]
MTGSRSKQNEALNQQVAALETRVGELDQKLAEIEAQLTVAQADQKAQAPAKPARKEALSPRQVQMALKAAGFYEGSVDGKLGPKTKQAVKAFQRANGLTPDGVIGSKTSAALAGHLEGKE